MLYSDKHLAGLTWVTRELGRSPAVVLANLISLDGAETSVRQIARDLGMTPITATNGLRRLMESGLVDIIATQNERTSYWFSSFQVDCEKLRDYGEEELKRELPRIPHYRKKNN